MVEAAIDAVHVVEQVIDYAPFGAVSRTPTFAGLTTTPTIDFSRSIDFSLTGGSSASLNRNTGFLQTPTIPDFRTYSVDFAATSYDTGYANYTSSEALGQAIFAAELRSIINEPQVVRSDPYADVTAGQLLRAPLQGLGDAYNRAIYNPIFQATTNTINDPSGTPARIGNAVFNSVQSTKNFVTNATAGWFFDEQRSRNIAALDSFAFAVDRRLEEISVAPPHEQLRGLTDAAVTTAASLILERFLPGSARRRIPDVDVDAGDFRILTPHFVPSNQARRNFGTAVHQEVPAGMQARYPDTRFKFNVGPGEKGPDVVYRPGRGPDPGFDFADLKPRTESGFEAFHYQIQTWPEGRAGVFFYDPPTGTIDFDNIFIFE